MQYHNTKSICHRTDWAVDRKICRPQRDRLAVTLYNIVDQIHGLSDTLETVPPTSFSYHYHRAGVVHDDRQRWSRLSEPEDGRGRGGNRQKGVGNAVTLVTIVSILLAVIFLIWIDPILTLFGATDVLRPFALEYGFIIGAGLPFMMDLAAINSMIRADGSPKYVPCFTVIGAIINVNPRPYFHPFVFQMGSRGQRLQPSSVR